jgi:hypothetical protein
MASPSGRQGWLQNPRTTETRRFHRDERSWSQDPMVFVDSGRPLPGQPALLQSRRYLPRDAAATLWQALLKAGWRPVAPQWGEDAEF